MDGGKPREAATRKEDHRILVQILGKDCVAIEVRYHVHCYKSYTSFLTRPSTHGSTLQKDKVTKYTKSFETFCRFVKEEIIDGRNICYMSRLKEKFIKTVRDIESEDASNYRSYRLKERLQDRYPQLVFHTPKVRNKSEIVYAEDLDQGNVAESLLKSKEEMNDSSDEERFEGDISIDHTSVALKDIYSVALKLKENIQVHSRSWYENWPPLSTDISSESVKKVVSPLLFNFISWLLGYSEDPEESNYVELNENATVKVFSICQDLVYNSSKGRNQTPKSLALAIAVKQISGCSNLIRVLNGLGHCVSLSSTTAYDTALAQLAINTSDIIPREFVPKESTKLVYDNIDFQEEITKQTHVTNGIIIQKVLHERNSRPEQVQKISKSQRSVKVPESDITQFSIGTKETPNFQVETRQAITMKPFGEMAQKIDLVYVLVKMVHSDSHVLPGWTGFNVLLQQDNIPNVSRVGYLPIIDAPPTEYSTINAILKRSTDIANKLELRYATLVFDEAVYSKVQHVRWKNEDFYKRFVVCLGEFHASMSFMSAISKVFEDGGLKVRYFTKYQDVRLASIILT